MPKHDDTTTANHAGSAQPARPDAAAVAERRRRLVRMVAAGAPLLMGVPKVSAATTSAYRALAKDATDTSGVLPIVSSADSWFRVDIGKVEILTQTDTCTGSNNNTSCSGSWTNGSPTPSGKFVYTLCGTTTLLFSEALDGTKVTLKNGAITAQGNNPFDLTRVTETLANTSTTQKIAVLFSTAELGDPTGFPDPTGHVFWPNLVNVTGARQAVHLSSWQSVRPNTSPSTTNYCSGV